MTRTLADEQATSLVKNQHGQSNDFISINISSRFYSDQPQNSFIDIKNLIREIDVRGQYLEGVDCRKAHV